MAGSHVLEDALEAWGDVDAVAAMAKLLEVGAALRRGWRRDGGREEASIIDSAQCRGVA